MEDIIYSSMVWSMDKAIRCCTYLGWQKRLAMVLLLLKRGYRGVYRKYGFCAAGENFFNLS